MTLETLLIAVLPIAALAFLLAALPDWHREHLFFGVTVSPDFPQTPAARSAVRIYRSGIVLASLCAAVFCSWALQRNSPWLFFSGTLLQTAAAAILFARAHHRISAHRVPSSTLRAASLQPQADRLPGGWIAAVLPLVLLCATGLYLRLHWNSIPLRYPIHWGLSGEPNGWAHRTMLGVYGPLLIGVLICCFLFVMNRSILHGTRRGNANPESAAWHARFRRATLRLTLTVSWIIGLVFSAVALLPFAPRNAGSFYTWPAVIAILIALALNVWPLIRLNSEPGSGSDGTPDECWKWGEIYYNPSDPALMVERRFGIGYTFNFANRASWVLIAGTIALLAALTLIVAHA